MILLEFVLCMMKGISPTLCGDEVMSLKCSVVKYKAEKDFFLFGMYKERLL